MIENLSHTHTHMGARCSIHVVFKYAVSCHCANGWPLVYVNEVVSKYDE